MATKVTEDLIDDLDGSPASHTVRIGWGNEWRELDLSDKNLENLAKGFDDFWDVARPVAASRTTGPRPSRPKRAAGNSQGSSTQYDRPQFRAWAARNGIKLKRGRPPRALVDRFLAASR